MAEDLFRQPQRQGELATARLLTVAETCDPQRINILAYLSATRSRPIAVVSRLPPACPDR